MSKTVNDTKIYWDEFYTSPQSLKLKSPSQFATFIMSEFASDETFIIDVGCGTGKDTLFFSRFGFNAVGVDRSPSAINICNETCYSHSLPASFFCGEAHLLKTYDPIKILPVYLNSRSILCYARFFLHAIPETEENKFLSILADLKQEKTLFFAAEFRTYRDALGSKVTADHYRRYIDPDRFLVKAVRAGFDLKYYVQGFGYAKYKSDDAHVARFLLSI